jgi:endoglucanase
VLPRNRLPRALALLTSLALAATLGLTAPAQGQARLAGGGHGDAVAKLQPKHKPHHKPKKDPRLSRGLYVDPKMPAYQQGGVYRQRIGKRSQALWVIPEAYSTRRVQSTVRAYTGLATKAKKIPVLSVYGIPGRDCGQYSSGNPLKTAAQYRAWIKQISIGLRGQHAMVILEPDALPLFSSSESACPTKPNGWQGMLRYATRTLSKKTGAWVYLDAGHSNWTPYDTRPKFLKASGVQYARGISTNVSNFRPLADEQKYAATMLAGLRKLGIKGKHYVVDTSRNGATPSSDGYDVLNPTWARLGKAPQLVFKGAFDGTLWVKHPGESDGQVNGGNSSGKWCDMLADRLLTGSSSQSSCPE